MKGYIRCLGCDRRFGDFEAFQRHRWDAPHPDQGEVYVPADAWTPEQEARHA